MGDNIKDLPTDNYPIPANEKLLVEKFFSPINEMSDTSKYDDIKIPVILIILYILFNIPQIHNVFVNLFGDEPFKINILKAIIIGLLTYIILKINLLKV